MEGDEFFETMFEEKSKMTAINNLSKEDPSFLKENSKKNIPPELEKVTEKFKFYLKSKEVKFKIKSFQINLKIFFCFS